MKKTNVYDMVTSRILEQLEQGIIPWHKPWTGTAGAWKGYNMIVYIPTYTGHGWEIVKADTEKTLDGKKQFRRLGNTEEIIYCGTIYHRAYRTEAEAYKYIHKEYAEPLTWDEMEGEQ